MVKVWSARSNGTGVGIRRRPDGSTEEVKLYWKKLNVADRFPRHLLVGETIKAEGFEPVPIPTAFRHQGRSPSAMRLQARGITRVEFDTDAAA